jgi:hypothetical protein
MNQTVTRKQLQSYGISRYHSLAITKNIPSVSKHRKIYLYELIKVIAEIRIYVQRPHIQSSSRKSLSIVLDKLLDLLANVVEVPFLTEMDTELRTLVVQLTKAMNKTNASLSALKVDSAEIKYKYGIQR